MENNYVIINEKEFTGKLWYEEVEFFNQELENKGIVDTIIVYDSSYYKDYEHKVLYFKNIKILKQSDTLYQLFVDNKVIDIFVIDKYKYTFKCFKKGIKIKSIKGFIDTIINPLFSIYNIKIIDFYNLSIK